MKKEKEKFTYEMLLESFREVSEMQKKSEEKSDKAHEQAMKNIAELRELHRLSKQKFAETDRYLSKKFAETDRLIKANAKQIGGIDRSNGLMAEEAVFNVLDKDKTFAGIKFDDIHKNIPIMSGFKTLTELDILMTNGDFVSLIETKYKVEKKDISDLINKKLTYFRQYHPDYSNHKIFLGIGGMSFEDNAEELAKENGVGIIKIIGDKIEFYTDEIKAY